MILTFNPLPLDKGILRTNRHDEDSCLASPGYVQYYFPHGCDMQHLMQAPIVEYNYKDALQHRYLNKFFDISPGDYPAYRAPSFEAFIDIITCGLSSGMIPD